MLREAIKSFVIYISWAASKISFNKKTGYRFLLYHDINGCDEDRFEAHVRFVASRYDIAHENIVDMPSNALKDLSLTENSVIFTFDDGFASDMKAAAILEKHGARGIFFVCRDFVLSKTEYEVNLGRSDTAHTDIGFMNEEDIKSLRQRGHIIASHTLSHKNLTHISLDEVNTQMEENKEYLESLLGCEVSYVAYPFGSIDDINENSAAVAMKYYKKIFSGIRGGNIGSSVAIFRESVDVDSSTFKLGAILDGALDLFYLRAAKRLRQIVGVGMQK